MGRGVRVCVCVCVCVCVYALEFFSFSLSVCLYVLRPICISENLPYLHVNCYHYKLGGKAAQL